jgi:hypothetical protein
VFDCILKVKAGNIHVTGVSHTCICASVTWCWKPTVRLSVSETRDHTHGRLFFRCPVMSTRDRRTNSDLHCSRCCTDDMVHMSKVAWTTVVHLDNHCKTVRCALVAPLGLFGSLLVLLHSGGCFLQGFSRPKSWRQRPARLIVTQFREKPCEDSRQPCSPVRGECM